MQRLDLNGKWHLRWSDGQRGGMPHYIHTSLTETTYDINNTAKYIEDDFDVIKWIDAAVPGEVHLDLINADIISPPYKGVEVLNNRWVEECMWFYRRKFDAPDASKKKNAVLKFDGLDYAAIIYLNGNEVARHENAFFPCSVNVAGLLKPKDNILIVSIESGLFHNSDKPIRNIYTATMTVDVLLHKRNWLRKTQSQMAWDWAPRLMNVGIYKPVEILFGDDVIIDEAVVNCDLNDNLDTGKVKVRLFASEFCKPSENRYQLKISVVSEDNDECIKSVCKDFDAILSDGILESELEVANPELWWPIGYGEQKIYRIEFALLSFGESESIIYEGSKLTGFRNVKVNQDDHPIEGKYFVFEINNEPVFMRGANLVPNDLIVAAFTKDRYNKMVDLALEANFNFLRIWGGGVYEQEALFEACDRKGIMLWQEFISACATIPDEKDFVESIKKEAVYQVRRLSNHPSLIAWCGNNEVGWAAKNEEFNVGIDNPLYEKIFPDILAKEDSKKYYQPTSPWSPDGKNFNSETVGDQHPWSVGFMNKDSRDYEKMVCRFPNEGGIQGPVSLKTMKACLREGEGIHSFSWQVHDNMLESWMPGSSPDNDVLFWLGKKVSEMSVEEYVFAGGIVQAEGLKRYIESFRSRKYSSSGAVFWMFNDCWPTTRSWTIVDYYLNKTPSFHPVRRTFNPIAPIIANRETEFLIYGANDLMEDFEGTMTYGVFTTAGGYVEKRSRKVVLPANKSIEIDRLSKSLLEKNGEKKSIAFVCLYDKTGKLVGRTRYSELKLFELELTNAEIKFKREKNGCWFESNSFVMGISLGLDGDEKISDNFFDLYPNQPYFVETEDINSNMICYDLNSYLGADVKMVEDYIVK